MASWFYLYLYTDHPLRQTTETVAEIRKETHIMSSRAIEQLNIEIDEGTSHWIEATVNDSDGSAMDLTGCRAVFTMNDLNRECFIMENEVNVKLEPEETTGFLSSGYQIRIFDSNDDVFQVIQGHIYIRQAHKPYTAYPGGE